MVEQNLPQWAQDIAVYYAALSIFLHTAASWLSQVLPPPADIGKPWYTIAYQTIERISLAKRKAWNGNGNGQTNGKG